MLRFSLTQHHDHLSRRALLALGASTLAGMAEAAPSSPSQIKVPVSDARNIEASAVRFSAAQATRDKPVVVLFGGDSSVWPKIVGAVQQSIFNGYPVGGIFIGSPSAEPMLEIWAKGQLVSQPIDPRFISKDRMVLLLRNTHREFYGRRD